MPSPWLQQSCALPRRLCSLPVTRVRVLVAVALVCSVPALLMLSRRYLMNICNPMSCPGVVYECELQVRGNFKKMESSEKILNVVGFGSGPSHSVLGKVLKGSV